MVSHNDPLTKTRFICGYDILIQAASADFDNPKLDVIHINKKQHI